MSWTPWIRIEPEDSDDVKVQKLYKKARKPMTGKLSDLTQLTSLSPNMSDALHSLGVAVYRDAGSLSLREKEVAALVASVLVGCVHWTATHRDALGRAARDEKLAAQVAEDYTKADLTERERLIADYAVKVTRSVDTCSPQDVKRLREAGFGDEDILGIVGIVTYQNMTTRIMEALSTVD